MFLKWSLLISEIRRRKCDEGKPSCNNCLKSGKVCEGYDIKLSFDVDDSRNSNNKKNAKGETVHGFRGRPRLRESLAKRSLLVSENAIIEDTLSSSTSQGKELNISTTTTSGKEEETGHITSENYPCSNSSNSVLSISELTQNPTCSTTTDEKIENSFTTPDILNEFHKFQDIFPSFVSEADLPPFLDGFNDIPDQILESKDVTKLSYFEENMMLKHFFKRLLPLLDAHPSTPWPQLALKYCDFEVAKSCFISLACIHLYETKGAKEFYRTGMSHINTTMEYLIEYLRDKSLGSMDDGGSLDVDQIIKKLKQQPLEKQRSNFFVILLLIHVHLLFSVLESGRSALVRTFFQLFGAIVKDSTFKAYLENIEESLTLIATLSWFDTITSVVSPDCRLPYCEDSWYGDRNSLISTSQVMGCPGEIFRCISKLCELRKGLKECSIDQVSIKNVFNSMKVELSKYKEYVIFSNETPEDEIILRIKCAHCWAIAVLLNLYRLVKPQEKDILNVLILEFISIYGSMEPTSSHVTQMVWPVFTMACVCQTDYQRNNFRKFIDVLYTNAKMGTIHSIGVIAEECWNTGKSWEDVLSSKEWFGSGIDFLVV